jgi:hypothetical protein
MIYSKRIASARRFRVYAGAFTAALFAALMMTAFAPSARAAAGSSSVNSTPVSSAGLQVSNLSVDDKEDFVVEPGKMEVHLDPGQSVTKYISVTSRIKRTTEFSVRVEDFVGSSDPANPVTFLGDKSSPYSLKEWLNTSVDSLSLALGDRVALPVTITVPKSASPGGYYATVIISNAPQIDKDGPPTAGTAKIISRIGMLFFVRVNGPVNESGALQDFRIADQKLTYPHTPLTFQVLFNNTGSVYLAPYGDVRITNFMGHELADLPIDAYFSLPDSLRYRNVIWPDDQFRIGRYKATLSLNRGYGNVIDTKVVAFWVIPWIVVLYGLGGLLVLIGIIFFFLSRFELRKK